MVEEDGDICLAPVVTGEIAALKNSPSSWTNGCNDENALYNAACTAIPNGHSMEAKTKVYTSREKELIRVIGQFFSEVGLPETAKCLARESQCRLEHPAATKLRHHVVNGNWRSAEACLDELQNTLNHNTHLQRMRYLLYEQKYLELLDDSRIVDAIKCLRKDLAKIPGKQSRCHYLASLAMYTSKEDLRKFATWPGKGHQSRVQLMDKINNLFPPSIMLPRDRLLKLVDQSLHYQISTCTYHVVSNETSASSQASSPSATENRHQQTTQSLSLLTDHKCSKHQFPCRMKQTIVDYEEYLFCKFNHKGNTLAAGGNSGLISLFTVTEQHQLKAFETKLDHESAVGFFSWSPDDRYLLSCGARIASSVIVWNTLTLDKLVRVSNAADDSLTTCCWLPDSSHFAVAGIQGHFYLCDLYGNVGCSWEGIRVIALAALNRESTVLAADNHNRVRSYTSEKDATLIQTDKPIMSMEVSKCDQFLLCTMEKGGGLQLFHLESGTLLMRFAGLKQEKDFIFSCMGGSVDDNFIASGSEDRCVYVWHKNKPLPIAVLSGHTKQVNSVDWNPAINSMLVSVSDDCTIKVWGPANKAEDATDYSGAVNEDCSEMMNSIFQSEHSVSQHSSTRALFSGSAGISGSSGMTSAVLSNANLENIQSQSAAMPWYLLELGATSGGGVSSGSTHRVEESAGLGVGRGSSSSAAGAQQQGSQGAATSTSAASAYSSSSIGWL